MSAQMIPFQFNGHVVRAFSIDGEPAFVGKDVCERLGYADPTNAMKQHCKGVVKRHPLQTPGGVQKLRVLGEPDVLRLIVKSTLPEAVQFEKLVFEEILPSIRKTGSYGIKPSRPLANLGKVGALRKAIALHGSIFVYHKRKGMDLTQARLKADADVKEQTGIDLPKELGWHDQPLLVQEHTLTATQIGERLGLGARETNQLLKAQGFHTDERDAKNRIIWTPTEKGRPFGRYEDKAKVYSAGTVQPWGWFSTIVDVLRPFAKKPEAVS